MERMRLPARVVGLMACTARHGVIGKQGRIPWKIPHELAHFQRTSFGRIVVMGRRTFEEMSSLALFDARVGVVVSRSLAEGSTAESLHFLRRSAASASQDASVLFPLSPGDVVVAKSVRDFADRVFPAVVARAPGERDRAFLIGGDLLATEMLEAGLVDEFILSIIYEVIPAVRSACAP
jgi:dihydrofolate reductase